MIEQLRIRGLGVIDDAVIELSPGLTAITGETGAGKTMVLTGLGLLAGGRPDPALVRRGVETAVVDGEWRLDAQHPAVARLVDAGATCEPDGPDRVLALLGRTVAAQGRSRAVAGGRSVPTSVLQETCALLLAVHGQADQAHLRTGEAQRELLDRFGGPALLQARDEVRIQIERWRTITTELTGMREQSAVREREAALLAHGIAEIDAVDPQPGEDLDLDQRAARLEHAGTLLALVQAAHDALVGGDDDGASAVDAVAAAMRSVERASEVDASLRGVLERLREVQAIAADAAAELAHYAAGVEADPSAQAWVEERRAALAVLRRRYGATIDDVLAWRDEARTTVDAVGADPQRMAELEAEAVAVEARVRAAVATLTAKRQQAAERLAAAVGVELAALAMPDAAIEVRVEPSDDPATWTINGADRVAFWLRPHRGGDLRPLATSASGGELSRVMLAIEVVLAGTDPVPTFVFDEVDAGIGGRAAVEVGRRLARLARTSQVIVVTHLPQVAAFADAQVTVAKDASGLVTTASVRRVEGDSRVAELVRMLSGLDGSAAGAAHARELLDLAEAEGQGAVSGESPARGRRKR